MDLQTLLSQIPGLFSSQQPVPGQPGATPAAGQPGMPVSGAGIGAGIAAPGAGIPAPGAGIPGAAAPGTAQQLPPWALALQRAAGMGGVPGMGGAQAIGARTPMGTAPAAQMFGRQGQQWQQLPVGLMGQPAINSGLLR